jgi:hypothetical protein
LNFRHRQGSRSLMAFPQCRLLSEEDFLPSRIAKGPNVQNVHPAERPSLLEVSLEGGPCAGIAKLVSLRK